MKPAALLALSLLFACGGGERVSFDCGCISAGLPNVACAPTWGTYCYQMREPAQFIDYCFGWRDTYVSNDLDEAYWRAKALCAASDPCINYCTCSCTAGASN